MAHNINCLLVFKQPINGDLNMKKKDLLSIALFSFLALSVSQPLIAGEDEDYGDEDICQSCNGFFNMLSERNKNRVRIGCINLKKDQCATKCYGSNPQTVSAIKKKCGVVGRLKSKVKSGLSRVTPSIPLKGVFHG